MIYCVVPEELTGELYDKLTDYYSDDPNVTVIVDRRRSGRADAVAAARRERDRKPAVQDDAPATE